MTEPLHDSDSLARQLDRALPPGSSYTPEGDPHPLINMAARIASAPHPEMPSEVAVRIRAQVLAAQRRQTQNRASRFRPSFYWVAVASIALVLFSFGLAPTILASVPGDTLYSFKQVVEWGELSAAQSPQAQAFTHLLHAERRAQEALKLSKRGQLAPELFAASLAEMALAAEMARNLAFLSPATIQEMAARSAAINAALDSILKAANELIDVPDSTRIPLMTSVYATQHSGKLLLPTATPSPSATATLTSTATTSPSPTASPSATLPAAATTVAPTASPPPTISSSVPPAVSSATQAVEDLSWDENTDCSSPPPTWVPAEGWRARCEGAPRPQDELTEESKRPPGAGPPVVAGPPPHAGPPG